MTVAVTAGEVLASSDIDVAEVRRVLPAVDPFAVPVRVAPRAFRALWIRGIVALTTPWAIYVTPTVMRRIDDGATDPDLAVLMVHELTHVDQLKRLGLARHLGRYLGAYCRSRLDGRSHWDAYRKVPLEAEARYVAAGFRGDGEQ